MGYKFNPFSGNFDIDSEGSDWKLTGNSGLTAGTNFIGTTDAVDVVFKRNSTEVMRIADESKVGIQTSTPQNPLQVVASVGDTINSVTTASVTTASESLNTSPTGAVTLIAEFAALSGSGTSQNTSGSGYTATGQTIDYQVYQLIYINGTYYKSANFESLSFTDGLNDNSNFSIVINFGTPDAETTDFFIEKQVNGGGFNDSIIVIAGFSYEDQSFSGSASPASWPTQYVLSYTTPTAPSGATGQEINVGAGNLTESGVTYNFEIREAANVGGTYYCEQTGTSGSFTDANMANTFDLQVDWTAGTGDEQVIRISTDGGASWSYQFVGGGSATSFVWTNQGSDSAAETAWSNDIASVQRQYAFKAYAKTTAPSGNIVYNPSANTYYGTITTPNVYYIFKHVLTGSIPNGAKLVGDYNVGITNGLDIASNTVYDVGFSTWGNGTTTTPTTYAFANGTTRYFKLVGYNGTIYSVTPLVVNTTTSGSDKYFTGTFSYPSGVTQVKILISTDGVTYTGSKIFTSPTATFTFDATDVSYAQSTTITPTSLVPSGIRVDRQQTTVTDAPQLVVVENTGSGTRYAGIGFGFASSSTTAPSITSNILSEASTGFIRMGGSRVIGYTNVSQTTESWQLGSSVAFNIQKSSSCHTTFYSADSTHPTAYFYSAGDSNRGTAYFGQLTASFGTSSKVVICPTAGGTTSLHFRHNTGAETNTAILIDNGGSFVAGWAKGGRMWLNSTAVSSTTYLLIGGTGSGSQIRLQAGSSGTTEGDISNNSTQKCITAYVDGIQQYDTRSLFVQTATATCANTTTETTISSTGVGTLTLPANFFVAGKTIKIKGWGYHSSTTNPNLTIKVKFGSTVILTTGAHTMHNDTNSLWELNADITCRTTGGSGTVFAQGLFADYGTNGDHVQMVNTATTTISTTSSQAITITAQWGTASSSNTISLSNLTLEVLH